MAERMSEKSDQLPNICLTEIENKGLKPLAPCDRNAQVVENNTFQTSSENPRSVALPPRATPPQEKR